MTYLDKNNYINLPPEKAKFKATGSDIKHIGFVKKVTESSLIVNIISQSACSSCHANGTCSVADVQDKEIEIFNFSKNYSPGQQVTIIFKESKGFTALFFGYVLPFILVLLTLIISMSIINNELIAGLLSLAILVPYYVIIHFLNHLFKKVFNFEIEEIN